jgi:hypothetical protein
MFPVDPNYWEVVVYSMVRRAYDRRAARAESAGARR